MSSILVEPGQEVEQVVGSTFNGVPEVLAVKAKVTREARLGKPSPEQSGAVTEVVALLDGFQRITDWWKSASTNPFKTAYRTARGRRKITLWPYYDTVQAASKGRSAPQDVTYLRIFNGIESSLTLSFTAELRYADIEIPIGTGITVTPFIVSLTKGVTATCTMGSRANQLIIQITRTSANIKEAVLRIYGTEVGREILPASGLPAALAQINQTVVTKLP